MSLKQRPRQTDLGFRLGTGVFAALLVAIVVGIGIDVRNIGILGIGIQNYHKRIICLNGIHYRWWKYGVFK